MAKSKTWIINELRREVYRLTKELKGKNHGTKRVMGKVHEDVEKF